MSIVDTSWSEPHGIAVVEAASGVPDGPALATGTATLRAPTADGGGGLVPAPPRFFNMPVGRPPAGRACSTSRPALGHDATSIVMPLPRPREHDPSEPARAVVITSEHAARLRHRKTAARWRSRFLLIACPLLGIALGFLVLALLPGKADRRVASPAAPQQEEVAPAAEPAPAPAPAPVASPKPGRASGAPRAAARASKKPAASEPTAAVVRPAGKPSAAAEPKATAPASKPASKVAVRAEPAAKQPAAPASKPAKKVAVRTEPAAKQPAAAPPPKASSSGKLAAGAAAKPAAKPTAPAASKLAKATAPAKKPAPAKPAAR